MVCRVLNKLDLSYTGVETSLQPLSDLQSLREKCAFWLVSGCWQSLGEISHKQGATLKPSLGLLWSLAVFYCHS